MSLLVRPFTTNDYDAVATVSAAVNESTPDPEHWRWEDTNRDPKCLCARWVAEWDGRVVGFSEYAQYPHKYHPRKFGVEVLVLPEFRSKGIGSALWMALREGLRTHDPLTLTTGVREHWEAGLRFAQQRGFAERMRSWESHLDLTRFDPSLYADRVEGYQIRSYADLVGHPGFFEKLYELVQTVRMDVPSSEPLTVVPYESWLKSLQSNPELWPQGYLIATKGDEWVGVSTLWTLSEEGLLKTGLTAIRREHRGTGIAKALKVRALATAKEAGYKLVKTWNASNNERMLAINLQLGFERKPAWVTFHLKVKDEE